MMGKIKIFTALNRIDKNEIAFLSQCPNCKKRTAKAFHKKQLKCYCFGCTHEWIEESMKQQEI